MEPLLYLVHRIPFPPNKGDKIRSYHLLRHLARRYAVHLGTFVDAPGDRAHIAQLESLCAAHHVETLNPRLARLRSVSGFFTGEALTLVYYRSMTMQQWVRRVVQQRSIRKAVVFSGAMAQYVEGLDLRVVLDFVDVDSAKWSEYAERRRWPASFVYRREGRRLLSFERRAASASSASVFVTRAEVDLFERLAPECHGRTAVVEMGVNTDYFAPRPERSSPFQPDELPIVFSGAMDYWPNIDAATWFAIEVMPRIAQAMAKARFYVVGMNPSPAVTALAARPDTVVTGTVPDIRPYVQHAAVVVAPLRVARGVQSKVLEAMAMARPVVVSSAARQGLRGEPGKEYMVATSAEEFSSAVLALISTEAASEMGRRARSRILSDYVWERNLSAFDELLDGRTPQLPASHVH